MRDEKTIRESPKADEIYDEELRNFEKCVHEILPILEKYGYKFHGWTTQYDDFSMLFKGEVQFTKNLKEDKR